MRNYLLRVALGLGLAFCLAGTGRAAEADDDASLSGRPAFADDAVVTLNSKIDAAAGASSATTALATTASAAVAPGDGSAAAAEPPAAIAPSPESRNARLAALKARLREKMGGVADPPPEEPPLPPPPGPMIGLRQPQFLERMGISLSGWLEQGMTFNGDHPSSGFNGPVANNDLDREYQMNQLWLTLERSVTTGDGFDLGGRIDLTYGTDWRWDINNGLENRINGLNDQTYGLMLPQAYLEAAYNDLKVQLGHFDSGFDYEALPATANFFYSHSYCYTYAVPHQLTGMAADYRLDGNWSVQGGMHSGWNEFEDNNHAIDFLGGIRWQSSDRRTTVSYSLTNGPQDPAGDQNCFVYSFVVQEKLGPRSQYILVHDLGVEENSPITGRQAQWYGLNQYYVYSLSSTLAACLRAEWFCDQDGVIVDGPGTEPGVRAWSGRGFAGNFYEVTAGLNFRPHQNLIFRPEVRYDWYDGGAGNYGSAGQPGLPFNDGRSSTQLLTAADLILLF
jgi:hypothetical protein